MTTLAEDLAAHYTAWLAHLRVERGYSPRTLAAYAAEGRCLLAHLVGCTGDEISETVLRGWMGMAAQSGLAASSLARRLSVWRGLLDWLTQRGVLAGHSARAMRAPRRPKRLPKSLAPDVAWQLMQGPPGSAADRFEHVRDQAILELLYSSGLRVSELTGLDVAWTGRAGSPDKGWLEYAQAQVQVWGKGGKRRAVPVGRAALQALADWLALRQQWLLMHPQADRAPLFLSVRGQRLSNRSVQRRVAQMAIARGVAEPVHPHRLRHACASHLLQSSGDLRAVQELLGHASIATTQVYTALDFQRLAAVYDLTHPRARRPSSFDDHDS